ncbi:2'-5' RNA ligase family protein [Rhodococcus sp. X156]|uniref:2'-5' RNA ligase family protein n=1 Tax=Rhodococcus sp. X156 TaxID=2499145 RepID=UPI000FDB2921|nr:2'-5' RNA ligase family protein [Rhodococcus sp. X156]
MAAALELRLDARASRRIVALWEALEAEGVHNVRSSLQQHRPHVSLAVAGRLDPAAVAATLAGVAVAPPLRLSFTFVGLFLGRVLWLGPAPHRELLEHQAHVHHRLTAAGIDVWDEYRPDSWVPHCTVSMRVSTALVGAAVRRCLETLPIEATVVGAAVTDHVRGIDHPLPAGAP